MLAHGGGYFRADMIGGVTERSLPETDVPGRNVEIAKLPVELILWTVIVLEHDLLFRIIESRLNYHRPNVATASTSVPAPVTSEEIVDQSVTFGRV